MEPEERAQEEGRRPKVVDKRVSSGGHDPKRPEPEPPPPAPPPSPPPPPRRETKSAPGETKSEGGPGGEAKLASDPPGSERDEPVWTPEEEAQAMQMAQEIAERPGLDWVVNTAVTLANVAATKLQVGDPADAQVCIDALAGILSSTTGRLQDAEAPLKQTLAQLQMAYAQRVTSPAPEPPG